MTLAELRQRTLFWIDLPQGTGWINGSDSGRLDAVINEAYQNVVHELVRFRSPLLAEPQAGHARIALTQGTREYAIVRPDGKPIRAIIETYPEYSSTNFGRRLDEVDYADRFGGTSYANRAPVYYFRTADDAWYVGFVSTTPSFPAVWVSTLSDLKKLIADTDVPTAVPGAFHECIALSAATMCKIIKHQDPGGIAQLEVRCQEQFRASASGMFDAARVVRGAV